MFNKIKELEFEIKAVILVALIGIPIIMGAALYIEIMKLDAYKEIASTEFCND